MGHKEIIYWVTFVQFVQQRREPVPGTAERWPQNGASPSSVGHHNSSNGGPTRNALTANQGLITSKLDLLPIQISTLCDWLPVRNLLRASCGS